MKGVITIAYNNLEKSIETKNILVEKLNKAGFEISENIEVKNNHWEHIGGGYPYIFEWYSAQVKDVVIEDNYFSGNYVYFFKQDPSWTLYYCYRKQ